MEVSRLVQQAEFAAHRHRIRTMSLLRWDQIAVGIAVAAALILSGVAPLVWLGPAMLAGAGLAIRDRIIVCRVHREHTDGS